MNKKLNYTIEYMAKTEDESSLLYEKVLEFFKEHYIYTASKYELSTLSILANKSDIKLPKNFKNGVKKLDIILEKNLNGEIKEAKRELLYTISKTNFPKKQKYLNKSIKKFEEKLEKVELKIYQSITAYIYGITRVLELFYVYTYDEKKEPELFIEYANTMHIELIELIFNKEEKELLSEKLKEIMSVYLSLYARYLYM